MKIFSNYTKFREKKNFSLKLLFPVYKVPIIQSLRTLYYTDPFQNSPIYSLCFKLVYLKSASIHLSHPKAIPYQILLVVEYNLVFGRNSIVICIMQLDLSQSRCIIPYIFCNKKSTDAHHNIPSNQQSLRITRLFVYYTGTSCANPKNCVLKIVCCGEEFLPQPCNKKYKDQKSKVNRLFRAQKKLGIPSFK